MSLKWEGLCNRSLLGGHSPSHPYSFPGLQTWPPDSVSTGEIHLPSNPYISSYVCGFRASNLNSTYITACGSHTRLRQIDFSGFLDVKGDKLQWLLIYVIDKSFCCLWYAGDSKIWLCQGELFTLRTWTRSHNRRSMHGLCVPKNEWSRQHLRSTAHHVRGELDSSVLEFSPTLDHTQGGFGHKNNWADKDIEWLF